MTHTWANPNDTTPQAIPEEIKQLLQKLQALAERGGTDHEAATASAMLQKHMAKWNVSLIHLETFKRGKVELTEHILTPNTAWLNRWKWDLWTTCARANFCDTIRSYDRDGIARVFVVGHAHNQAITEQMYQYLEKNIKQAWKVHAKVFGITTPPFTPYEVTRMRVSFATGFDYTVSKRLQKPTELTHDESSALAILNEEVDAMVKETFPDAKPARQPKIDANAFHAGMNAGKAVNLDAQVTNTNANTKALAQG